ncbi:helix-turn-helix domain-containing protein [Cuniculiplasma divulgatum]|uniref:IS630 family transposase OrfA n=1 Tax=Cuniculiplasma divulgatum TaxID=1673428 RepID=A0A1N5WIV7_9ARCH|nr:helix-turn-helix domain-containing protein [Cuniculiplasma divulgatum]SIM84595.1 IS630 family transposase OrfA [Cuniculiplasma divulgatum]
MSRVSRIEVKRHLQASELRRLIREEQKRGKIIQRLIFINDLYDEKSVPEAAKHAGVVKTIAYEWLRRWNESGYEGLIPRYAGGKPSKLSTDQKSELKSLLEAKDLWSLREIEDLIRERFQVQYSERQVRRMLKGMKMKHAKPYQVDYRKPNDAREKLKKTRFG